MVVHDDGVDYAANASAGGSYARGNCHRQEVRTGNRVLRIFAARVDDYVIRKFRRNLIGVGDCRNRKPYAYLGGARRQGTRNQARGGVRFGGNLRVTRNIENRAAADLGFRYVKEEHAGNRARNGGFAARAAADRARDGLGVIVIGREEVEKVDRVEHGIRADVDRNFITVARRRAFLDIDNALLDVRIRYTRGVGQQQAQIERGLIVREVHALFGGAEQERRGLDLHVFADQRLNGVPCKYQRERCANADARALGNAQPARAYREFALIFRGKLDLTVQRGEFCAV
ncbi:hypothetical protein SDC9_105364 [bioreactor metagenome]|uniref:Uncharacterized protein n=1 Tax=bioreactor metagenome TaxID=1076179 RepID=A0A645B5W7_9ZZZZ